MQPNDPAHVPYSRLESRAPGRMTRDPRQALRENTFHSHSRDSRWPMRSDDSWIEVSSQRSSSSLSSAATSDDIITAGLGVEHQESAQHRARRRRLHRLSTVTHAEMALLSPREPSMAGSSQDEYEESESESDRVLSSSNEDMRQTSTGHFLLHTGFDRPAMEVGPSSDEDDSSTALGLDANSSSFIPQPNVFSHPPATQHPSWTRPTDTHRSQRSVLSSVSRQTAIRRDSHPSTRPARGIHQHSPYNMMSPSYHADHDAALRASLSTLLSCAAAARGLPKHDTQPPGLGRSCAPQPSSQFRLVSEAVVMGEEGAEEAGPARAPSGNSPVRLERAVIERKSIMPQPARSTSPTARPKRRSSSSKDRTSASKKSRRMNLTDSSSVTSPTLMTWVISAGVVVLFSAISFSAGYMLGREVGRTEVVVGSCSALGDASGSLGSARGSAGCGREAVKGGLKRLKWGTAVTGSSIIA